MRRVAVHLTLAGLALAGAQVARAGTGDVGNVAVVEDTQNVIVPHCDPGANGSPTICASDTYCKEAAKYFYQTHCDDYDALVVFLDYTWQNLMGGFLDDPMGNPVQEHINGIDRDQHFDHTAQYGSAGRLEQCVSLTTLGTKPDNPDDQVYGIAGLPLPLGISGIELVGHEIGHHWLMGAEFDLGKGLGVEELLRQCDQNSHPCVPNLHYSGYVNSHSVMYGNFLTDNGDGSFTVCGGTRGYSELDQYLMGLRPASQMTNPNDVIWALDDGYHYGAADSAYQPGAASCSTIAAGKYTRVDIGIDDFIRAMGPWSGPAAEVPIGWNVGFILVEPAGHTASAAAIAKVDAYRSEFETWFTTATAGLGSVHTELVPNNCILPPPTDGGTPDAGSPDAGTPDAGTPDAGIVDAGTPDAGSPPVVDAGTPDAGVVDAGPPDAGAPDAGKKISTLAPAGCGCTATSTAGTLFPALGLLVLAGLRRRRRA